MEQEKTQAQTPDERYHQETHCQSCGRFVGIYSRCPYCQALTQKRLSIRVFKVIAVLTSTVGLLMLLFFARHVKTPEVKLADLGPLSNFAHVRIQGVVDQSYGIHPKWGSLGFVIAQGDDTKRQTIRVSAYAKVAKEIEARNLVPNKGDLISVEGQVRFQKDSASLLINAYEHIAFIKRATPDIEEIKIVEPDKIDNSMIGRLVTVTGSVLSIKVFPDKGQIINLDNGESGLPVWLPADCMEQDPQLKSGDLIEATGKVETFKDKLEVKVNRKGAFKVISKVSGGSDVTAVTASSSISAEETNKPAVTASESSTTEGE